MVRIIVDDEQMMNSEALSTRWVSRKIDSRLGLLDSL